MERSSFFNAMLTGNTYDRVYKAEDFARYFASFIGNGVYANPVNNLQVVAVDNNMNVRVKAGRAWINGYFYENTDELHFTLAPADGVLHRIDRMVVRLDLINRQITTLLKQGTPASVPVAPSLERNDDIYEIALGDIRINAGVIQITQSNITDQRYIADLCGIVAGIVSQIDTTDLFSQFEDEFSRWFDAMKDQLTTDAAGSLQLQLNDLKQLMYEELKKYLLLTGGTIAGNLIITGTTTIDGNSTTKGTHYVGGNLIPNGTGNQDLGYTNNRWETIWGKEMRINRVFNDTGNLTLGSANGHVGFEGHAFPATNGAYNCGTATNRWSVVYANNGTIQTSDERYKDDIIDIDDEQFYEMIKGVSVNTYVMRGTPKDYPMVLPERDDKTGEYITQKNATSERVQVGIIAQELDEFDCGKYVLIKNGENDYLAINPYNYAAAIHAALKVDIKNLDEEIQKRETLEKEFNEEVKKRKALEEAFEDLLKRVEVLELA